MPARSHVSLSVKLAATLLQMKRVDESGKLVPVIPYEKGKTLTAKEIISRFQFDHYPIMNTHDGPAEPWNLTPRLTEEHAMKTTGRRGESRLADQANGDTPRAAKLNRISAKQAEFRARLLAKAEGREPPQPARRKHKIPSRPFPKRAKHA